MLRMFGTIVLARTLMIGRQNKDSFERKNVQGIVNRCVDERRRGCRKSQNSSDNGRAEFSKTHSFIPDRTKCENTNGWKTVKSENRRG